MIIHYLCVSSLQHLLTPSWSSTSWSAASSSAWNSAAAWRVPKAWLSLTGTNRPKGSGNEEAAFPKRPAWFSFSDFSAYKSDLAIFFGNRYWSHFTEGIFTSKVNMTSNLERLYCFRLHSPSCYIFLPQQTWSQHWDMGGSIVMGVPQ